MLISPWPPVLLFILRHGLFLGPLAMAVLLMIRHRDNYRMLVGALFSLLYGLSLVFVGHVIAVHFGLWSYGSHSLKLLGFPADIWFAGALLWGPVLFLALPETNPWLLVLPCIALNGIVMPALDPFVGLGDYWFLGVVLVFLTAHLPALYLARWTTNDTYLPFRAALLAIGYGCFAFFVLPTVIMNAMGGDWSPLMDRPAWVLIPTGLMIGTFWIMGLSGVQIFVLHGDGTAIPLDPTKRLVRSGIYSYLSNCMQLSTALTWLVMGAVLGNVWVALAAVMAVCFVLGIVRWHHRQDLAVRFPQGWPEYRANIPEWLPRWRPWVPQLARFDYDPSVWWQRHIVNGLKNLTITGLEISSQPGSFYYYEPYEGRDFIGLAALAKALNHANFITAIVGAVLLLIVEPINYVTTTCCRSLQALMARNHPKSSSWRAISVLGGIDHLLRLRKDQLSFYRDMQIRHGDHVLLRLGPYRVWLCFHPSDIEAVLATHAPSFIRFEPVMRVLAQWNGRSLLVSEGERWRSRRRQVLPAFASRRLPGYGDRIVDRTIVLRNAWESATQEKMLSVDTDREMVALALDIAADSLFGEHLGSKAAAVDESVATLSDVAFRESTNPIRVPDWLPFPGKARKRRAIAALDKLVKEIVTTRMAAPPSDIGDLLSILIEEGRADPQAVRDEVMTLLIAGHETTSATLSWASYLLGQNSDTLDDLHDEIDRVIGNRRPSANDLHKLPLLRAVIDETLRLYPPAYTLFPRRAVEDIELEKFTIRKGDLVNLIPFTTQRDPRWFEEPTRFLPSRFLNEPTWPRYAYVPFGAGPRVCIGQAFGLMEVALVLATLLQRFLPMPVSGEVVPEAKFSLRPKGGLHQEWKMRSSAD